MKNTGEKMSNILVTGGAGFIGSHTVDMLVEKGYNVTVLDNFERQVHMGKKPDYLNKRVNYIKGDVRFKRDWLKSLRGCEYVIHLAASVGVGQSFWEASKYLTVNTVGTSNLFEVLIKNKEVASEIKKVIVASSKSLYGEGTYRCKEHGLFSPQQRKIESLRKKEWEVTCPVCGGETEPSGIKEDKEPQNLSPYAMSKYDTEKIALDYSEALGIPTVALRYFNAYGPRQSLNNPYTGVLAIFLSRLKNNNRPFLYEDGKQMRDYVYVDDIARINTNALERGEGVYNVATGKGTSLLRIVELLNRSLGMSIEPEISEKFRIGDNRHDFGNVDRLTTDFGSLSFTRVEDGIENLVEWGKTAVAKDSFLKQEEERIMYVGGV